MVLAIITNQCEFLFCFNGIIFNYLKKFPLHMNEVHSKYLYKVGKEKNRESIKGNALGLISHSKTI